MSSKISDFKPSIVIDIGTDKTKYSMSELSTYSISNLIKQKIQKKRDEKIDIESKIKQNQYRELADHLDYNEKNEFRGDSDDEDNYRKEKHTTTQGGEGGVYDCDFKTPTAIPFNNYDVEDIENNHNIFEINPNTIYDIELFVKNYPTLLYNLKLNNEKTSDNDGSEILNYGNMESLCDMIPKNQSIIDFNFEFHGEKANYDLMSNKFGFEKINSGLIYDPDAFEYIIDSIGKTQIGYNYMSSSYSENPIIMTQKSLRFEQLQKQVRMQYEYLFETFKCPYVLFCSQSLLNLFSYNQTTGVV